MKTLFTIGASLLFLAFGLAIQAPASEQRPANVLVQTAAEAEAECYPLNGGYCGYHDMYHLNAPYWDNFGYRRYGLYGHCWDHEGFC